MMTPESIPRQRSWVAKQVVSFGKETCLTSRFKLANQVALQICYIILVFGYHIFCIPSFYQ